MKINLCKILSFSLLISATLISGGALYSENKPKLNDILNEISKREKSITSVELDFLQEIQFTELKEKSSIIGRLKFKIPNKMTYETYNSQKRNTIKQSFISNGKKLWIYNPSTKQVFLDLWSNWKGIDYFIPGLFNPKGSIKKLKKVYDFSLEGEELSSYVLLLTPKEKVKNMTQIPLEDFKFYLWISKSDYHPLRSKFVTENVVTITRVENYKTNSDIPDDIFEFRIPEDAEVLRLFK